MSRTGEFTGFSQSESIRGPAPAAVATAGDAAQSHQDVLRGMDGKQACPFCGAVGEKAAAPCPRCGMDNTPEARKATKARIGPWYVLQARNPAAPGMRFETLLTFVGKGRVRPRSVVRGPTTHQLWRFAAHVKGLSREFGLCFSCGSSIETTANICPQCNRLQEPPINPDVLLEAVADDGAASPPQRAASSVYRELAEPLFHTPNAAASSTPVSPPATSPAPPAAVEVPEEIDIVIPALGGFGPDDLDARVAEAPPMRAAAALAMGPAPAHPSPAPSPLPPVPIHEPPAAAWRPAPGPPETAPSPAQRPATASAAGRPAADDNPFAIAPARKKPNGDASFLSAKDLAAAFQLSFDPSAEMERVDVPDRLAGGALADRSNQAATVPRNPLGTHTPPRGGGGFRRFLLFVFILAISGLAVLMWVDPTFRQRAVEWTQGMYARVRGQAGDAPRPGVAPEDNFDVPMPAAPTTTTTLPSGGLVNSYGPAGVSEASEEAPAAPESGSTAQADPAEAVEPEPEPATAADSEAETELEPVPAGANARKGSSRADGARAASEEMESARAKRPNRDAAIDEPADPEPDAESEPQPDGDDAPGAEKLSWRQLYSDGIDAESAGDYAAAVRAYERIKKLPKDQWPSDLQRRLTFSRSQIQSE